jgi:hypothetical protein
MEQISLDIKCAEDERRWFPENYINGTQFVIRLHNKLWYVATLINENWIVDGQKINKDAISHWAILDIQGCLSTKHTFRPE